MSFGGWPRSVGAETCEQGALREVQEETGCRAELDGLLTAHSWTLATDPDDPSRRPFTSIRVINAGKVVAGVLGTLEVDGSTDGARWWPSAEVAGQPHADVVDLGIAWQARRS